MAIVALLIIWVLVGAAIALRMVRRGHNTVLWFALSFYGPLLLLLASSARDQESPTTQILHAGERSGGSVDVVVGIDGSPESHAAAEQVIDLFGDALGALVLAAVVDFDVATYADAPDRPERDAREHLAQAAELVRERWGHEPTTVLLSGAPAVELGRIAGEREARLLAIGSRGHGGHQQLLGSVARHLAEGATVPVLIVGPDGRSISHGSTSNEQNPTP